MEETAEHVRRPPFGAEDVRRYIERRAARKAACAPFRDSQSSAVTSSPFLFHLLFQIAEVEGNDLRIFHQITALAGICITALVENVATIADLQATTGVLFDDNHGDTALLT